MKKLNPYGMSALLVVLLAIPGMPQKNKKLAQTGFEFLSVQSDGRAAGMGGAVNSLEMQSGSLFFNPAGMARMTGRIDLSASDNRWIADIHHNTYSAAFSPRRGLYGVLGFSVQSIDYGDRFYGTMVDGSEQGYVDTGDLSPSGTALGVGYAKALTDRFSVGGQVRWVTQDLGTFTLPQTDSTNTKESYDLTVMAYDFGTLFRTGFKSLVFGMSVRNFSKEVKYIEDGFQLPMVFTLGISMDLMDFFGETGIKQSLIVSADATHYRSHPEQVMIGLDYKMMNLLSLRTGYVHGNDEDGLSFGLGVTRFGFALDYAYTPFGIFDKVQRVTARFSY